MRNRTQSIIGLLLIAAGAAFFLDATDVIAVGELIANWWPLVLVGSGALALPGRPASRTAGIVLIIFGLALLPATTGAVDIPIWQLIIALLLVLFGARLILRGVRGDEQAALDNDASMTVILGDQRIVSEATAFRGGSLTVIMGDVTLDLRNATLREDGADIDVFCMLGELNIVVPREWRVEVRGTPILGEFKDDTDHGYQRPADAPLLTISGTSTLAEATVRHHN